MKDHSNEQLLWKMRSETRKQFVPMSGAFELTPRCTLDCAMCYIHLTKEQMGNRSELSTEKWIEIIDAAYNNGMVFSLLTGGECTLHDGFQQIYMHLKELGCIVTVNINGTILTDSILNTFIKSPPRCIQISLYGSNEDSYEKLTGSRCFEKVYNNICRLKEANLPVRIAITPNKYLQDNVLDILNLCKENGWKYLINKALIEAHYDTGRSINDFSMTVEEEISLQKRIHSSKLEVKTDLDLEIPQLIEGESNVYSSQCAAGKSSFAVSWDGKLRPCLADDSIEIPMLNHTFSEAWGELCIKSQNIIQPIECETCKMRKACYDCYITRSDPQNPGHRNAQTCKVTLNLIKSGIRKI